MALQTNPDFLNKPNVLLEENGEQRRKMEKIVLEFGERFIENLAFTKAFNANSESPKNLELEFGIREDTSSLGELLAFFDQAVLGPALPLMTVASGHSLRATFMDIPECTPKRRVS